MPESLEKLIRVLIATGPRAWLLGTAAAAGAGVVLAFTTALFENPVFDRMLPTGPLDYIFVVVASLLIGLTVALRPHPVNVRPAGESRVQSSVIGGGVITFFAVGCAICNSLVLLLLGTGGALAYFQPLQPVLGLAALVLLGLAVRQRLHAFHRLDVRKAS